MKYKEGDIVVLYTGETMYIINADKKRKTYLAAGTENADNIHEINESEILELFIEI